MIKFYLLSALFFFSSVLGQQGTLFINEFMASNAHTIQDEYGDYADWIEIYNASDSTINLGGFFISDDANNLTRWRLPDTSDLTAIESKGFIVLWADADTLEGALHLGFKLSASGESIFLTDSNGTVIIDQVYFPEQFTDISYGRQPDASENWYFLNQPTPGSGNINIGLTDKANPPEFSLDGGFYTTSQEITITSEYPDSLIFYTLNGSMPTIHSHRYIGPFNINSSSIIRARVIKDDLLPSDATSHSYFINNELHLPVVSIITDPSNLWGSEGLMDNKFKDWEKPINVEFFDNNFELGFQLPAGIKIHSPDGRSQQSFRIYARDNYGEPFINYRLFDDKEIGIFNVFILRNGGNDGSQLSNGTHIRDPFCHELYRDIDPTHAISASRPVHVYLNGSYWGIYNLRERQDKQYIETNFNYRNEIDFLERAFNYPGNRNAIEGDWIHYDAMRQFIVDNNLNDPANYDYLESQMDIKNFTDYWIFEVFAGNFDWLSNNLKFWRPRTTDGIWKWVLWDVDHGIGLPYSSYGNPEWNTLDWATGITGDRVGNGYNTIIIRGLLENTYYKTYFINRFADLLNTTFLPSHTIALMDQIKSVIDRDIDMQLTRWSRTRGDWENNLSVMRNYLLTRPDFVRQHILVKFFLAGLYNLTLDNQTPEYGSIELNTVQIDTFPWQGTYFETIPIKLTPKPNPGYVFSEWIFQTDSLDSYVLSGNSLIASPLGNFTATAKFVQDTFPRIIINEINYYPNDSFDPGDWVELYNAQIFPVALSNWEFKDNANSFTIPENTMLDPDNYMVLCQDKDDFEDIFGTTDYIIFELDFGFDRNGEMLKLLDDDGALIDSVEYSSVYPWPIEPNGAGYTLELIDPLSDNTQSQNWAASNTIGGTPGKINSAVTHLIDQPEYIPAKIQLFQNYPNPFNPETTIHYTVGTQDFVPQKVELSVYNILGQKVVTLVSEYQQSGHYSVQWDAAGFPTGIYFYRLKTDNFNAIGKMILMQ
ncbi:MAG: CotH kinase family protein [Calditrichaceae bacterium]|nr:CotH kinase family protein [Calditrichaceae bacterium]